MKLWSGYGSEHSMNLVLIGHFEDADTAQKAHAQLERLRQRVQDHVDAGDLEVGDPPNSYPDGLLDFLMGENIVSVGPGELEEMLYDYSLRLDGSKVVLKTEEIEVSVVLKLLVSSGARVEVFSAHNHPGSGYGRGERR